MMPAPMDDDDGLVADEEGEELLSVATTPASDAEEKQQQQQQPDPTAAAAESCPQPQPPAAATKSRGLNFATSVPEPQLEKPAGCSPALQIAAVAPAETDKKDDEEKEKVEVVEQRAPFAAQFDAAASAARFPHFSVIIARILLQGLFYESVFLIARTDGDTVFVVLGSVGILLSLIYIAFFAWVGYRVHHERHQVFHRYTIAYLDEANPEERDNRARRFARFCGLTGLFNRLFFFVRRYEAVFGNFSGTSKHLWLVPVLPVLKMFLFAILAGVEVEPGPQCSAVYISMATILFLNAIAYALTAADRLRFDVFVNTFLEITTAFMLLGVFDPDGLGGHDPEATAYLVIVYSSGFFSLVGVGFTIHEMFSALKREQTKFPPHQLGLEGGDDQVADAAADDDGESWWTFVLLCCARLCKKKQEHDELEKADGGEKKENAEEGAAEHASGSPTEPTAESSLAASGGSAPAAGADGPSSS